MNKLLTLFFIMIPLSVNAQVTLHGMWDEYKSEPDPMTDFNFNLDFSDWANEPINSWQTETLKTPDISGNVKIEIQAMDPGMVYFSNNETVGTIIIDTKRKFLYRIVNDVKAYRYPIGVGRKGFTWSGIEKVSAIEDWPAWIPPKEMLQRRPELPERMEGGIKNPLGAGAIYLGNTLYRIHGTNDPKSIGRAESSGCFRMLNSHIVHLMSITEIGDTVKVYN